jgi:hypothetical protein
MIFNVRHLLDLGVMEALKHSPGQVLEWIVARAHYKWEELKITPRPPLRLAMDLTRAYSPSSFVHIYGVSFPRLKLSRNALIRLYLSVMHDTSSSSS